MGWPDIAIGLIVAFGALKGFKRGFINELTGAVALACAIAAAFAYGGSWDAFLRERAHLSAGSAHVAGVVLYAIAAYAIVLALGAALSTVAKLPILGTLNALLGTVAGAVKAAVIVWAILYVVLFFPLPADVREALHRSALVAVLQEPNEQLDETVRASVPEAVRPFSDAMFARHRV